MTDLVKSNMLPEASHEETFRQWALIKGVDVEGLRRLWDDGHGTLRTVANYSELMRCCRVERHAILNMKPGTLEIVIEQSVSEPVLSIIENMIGWLHPVGIIIKIRQEKQV